MNTQKLGQALQDAQSDLNFGCSCIRENQGLPKACLIYIHNSVHCLYVGYQGVSLITLVTVCDIFIRTKATVCACCGMVSEHGFKHGNKHGIFFRKPIVILVHEHFLFFRHTFRTQ